MKERRSPSSLVASVSFYNQPYRCSTTLDLTTLSASSTLLSPPPVVWRYCNEGIAFNREACSLSLKRAAVVVRSRYGQTITNPPIARIGTPGRRRFPSTCRPRLPSVGKVWLENGGGEKSRRKSCEGIEITFTTFTAGSFSTPFLFRSSSFFLRPFLLHFSPPSLLACTVKAAARRKEDGIGMGGRGKGNEVGSEENRKSLAIERRVAPG